MSKIAPKVRELVSMSTEADIYWSLPVHTFVDGRELLTAQHKAASKNTRWKDIPGLGLALIK
jgi:hypothetical protein